METGFTDEDLIVMKSLKFDPSLKPNFESLKNCLVWEDERADFLSPDGYYLVGCLLIARSLLHRGLTFDDHPVNSEYCKNLWSIAQQQVSEWPGFKRIELNDVDKKYLDEKTRRAQREDL
jgi:hypothetical protein